MATETKKTSAFSMEKIFKSIVSPSSSGIAAAEEYIGNSAKKNTYISTDVAFKNFKDCLLAEKSHEVESSNRTARKPRTGKKTKQKPWIYHFSKQVKS